MRVRGSIVIVGRLLTPCHPHHLFKLYDDLLHSKNETEWRWVGIILLFSD